MSTAPQLGPFQLQRPLAKGGMARVWLARHIHHDEPVAIKVMMGEQARKPRFVESFHREIRAVARMNHPNLIRIFDYGEVSDEVASACGSLLTAKSPYMVMELADSTLADVTHAQLSWAHVHTMIVHILDALAHAHAHARGLIHRDLKPDNILLFSDQRQTQLKLSDFGIAHGMDGARNLFAEDEVITGTPRYMAPEQIRGKIRDQGPWTDLYALGCLAYWMITGRPPFRAPNTEEVLRAHLTMPRPTLTPAIDVPRRIEKWTMRLLERDPNARFRRAADAAAALVEIAGEPSRADVPVTTGTRGGQTMEITFFDASDATVLLTPTDAADSAKADTKEIASDAQISAPIPESWRRGEISDPSPKMLGVGQSLFELREIPLVGRHRIRDAMWEHLVDACNCRRPHVVCLQGAVGVGKSRLADWLALRAHEVGAAEVLHASHTPIDAPTDGLPRMFAAYLRCTGLSRDELVARIREVYHSDSGLGPDELHQCLALAQLIAPGADPNFDESQQTIRFTSPQQRWVVFKRLIERLATRRPLVVILDDVHWSTASLQFVEYLLRHGSEDTLPILVVMTVRRDLIDDNPQAARLLRAIVEQPCVRSVDVEPLSDEAHRELVENLLYLEPELAEQVARRTRGNPLFAIQLVGDWIERGLLTASEQGFCLTAQETPPLPEDMRAVLVQRLESCTGGSLHGPANDALRALELAATLGGDVDLREWRTVCDVADVHPPPQLLESLALHSLVRRSRHSWSFLHGALRETLLAIAEEQGRLPTHHGKCVQMLQHLYDTSRPSMAPRLADHLLGAQAWEQALEPLLRAISYCERTSDYVTGLEYFERYEKTRQKLNFPEEDERTLRGWLGAADLHFATGDVDEGRRKLETSLRHAKQANHREILAEIYTKLSRAAFLQGRYDSTITLAEEALAIPSEHRDADTTVRALEGIGWSYYRQSRYGKALKFAERSEAYFDTLDDRLTVARALNLLGAIQHDLGNLERTRDYFLRARDELRQMGHLDAMATITNNLGDMCRMADEPEKAIEYYREASENFRRVGAHKELLSESNLGVLHLEQSRLDDALPCFRAALSALKHVENASFAITTHLGLSACAAHRQDWSDYDHHFATARSFLAEVDYYNAEVGFVAQLTGQLLADSGKTDRARQAMELALDQWRELEEETKVAEVKSKLQSLS